MLSHLTFSNTRRLLPLFIGAFLLVSMPSHAETDKSGDGSQANPKRIVWDDLMPDDFKPEKLQEKYAKDIARLDALPDDSEEGLAIIERIQKEVDAIPANPKLDGMWVSLPGFIAPLEIKNAAIKRFLLVPYFGACIHVPPPPVNQTVLVDTLPNQGIRLHEVDYPFLVTGQIQVINNTFDIGTSGYHLKEAKVERYLESDWYDPEQ